MPAINNPIPTGIVPSGRGALVEVVDSLASDTDSQASCMQRERRGSHSPLVQKRIIERC